MIRQSLVALILMSSWALSDAQQIQAASMRAKKQPSQTQSCTLLAVTDGDTVLARCQDRSERVRLIGIDAPEITQSAHSERQAENLERSMDEIRQMGKAARAHLAAMIKVGETIELRQDNEARDRFGRLLAYVYGSKGEMLNSRMMDDGYAVPMTIKPNTTYHAQFEDLYARARRERRGLWSQK